MSKISELMRSTRAATAIEYGLILALIFVAIIAAVSGVAAETRGMWTFVSQTSDKATKGQ
ncbi:pilus assembly protein Flp/PilA [Sphingopyxis panaciterrae]|uniref:Flp family type IVb pilin n=1 Tax=Sphingopyxis panaciterrae TaxID=363841 RepID=UPI0014223C35|nr:Flp family type IVb pilin [Sphingopyxis panaciterrae]NIJ38539.1 pilus assembly protein Flp/PilA [Sphingopyxis panaciterrae]